MASKKSERANDSKMDRACYRLLSPLAPAPISPVPLSEGLRRAISRSNLSLTDLARHAGLDKGNLSRFLNGKGSLSLAAADKIAQAINWPVEMPHTAIRGANVSGDSAAFDQEPRG